MPDDAALARAREIVKDQCVFKGTPPPAYWVGGAQPERHYVALALKNSVLCSACLLIEPIAAALRAYGDARARERALEQANDLVAQYQDGYKEGARQQAEEDAIWRSIRAERARQEQFRAEGRFAFSASTDQVGIAVAILMEEVGEVAREAMALLGVVRESGNPDRYRKELVQVAAVAVAMIEAADEAEAIRARAGETR